MKIYFETDLKEIPSYCIPQDCAFHSMCDGKVCKLKSKKNIIDELTVKDFEGEPDKIDAQINGLRMLAEMLEDRRDRKKVKVI